jgi:hypothetical protein
VVEFHHIFGHEIDITVPTAALLRLHQPRYPSRFGGMSP